jgi:hypothetical protein
MACEAAGLCAASLSMSWSNLSSNVEVRVIHKREAVLETIIDEDHTSREMTQLRGRTREKAIVRAQRLATARACVKSSNSGLYSLRCMSRLY